MILTIIIAFFSLIALVVIHEFGHFLTAKKFGIKVEEFGIGYPPRLFGKKYKGTLYSLNLLPFGAFVKIYGHEERIDSPDSFSAKPIWQRTLVILGGVISFWIVAAILLTVVMFLGAPSIIDDTRTEGLVDPKVQIISISKDSPAEAAELEIGDVIRGIQFPNLEKKEITKIEEVIFSVDESAGEEATLTIQRGGELMEVTLMPRVSPPEGEGKMGVGLVRTALEKYPWYQAPWEGIKATGTLTLTILDGWRMVFVSLFNGEGVPEGVEVRGPIGIFELFVYAGGMGVSYFLQFIAIISVSLAILNALPIPALDGGWFVLLMIEKLRGKPINQKTEQTVSSLFFLLLIALMVWVTIKDIIRIF